MDSPVGELTLVATDGVLSGVYMHEQMYCPPPEAFGERAPEALARAVEELTEYFAGERTEFEVPVTFHGTQFQRTVWQALLDIPYGETTTYGELALRLGRTVTASRAVGLANGKNPISIIVPCHRVVGSTGDLTGYAGGIERKRFLLDLERGDTLAFALA